MDWSEEDKDKNKGLFRARQAFERHFIEKALQKCQWNQADAARLLKIHRNTLIQKMKSLNISPRPDQKADDSKFGSDLKAENFLSRP